MKMSALKKLGRNLTLAAVFATAAVSPVLAQQKDARGPQGNQQYSDLVHRVDGLADINRQITATQHTADVINVPVDKAAMAELRSTLKQSIDETAPRILLASDISAKDVQALLDKFKTNVGPLPDYLAKVDGKAKLVHVCQEQLVTPDGVYTKALASSVADCVASKQLAADTDDATPVTKAPEAKKAPVKAPVTVPVKAPEQTAPVTQPVAQQPSSESTNIFSKVTPIELGAGFAAVALLGGGTILVLRRRSKKPAENQPKEEAAAAPPPPAAPEAPAVETKGDDTAASRKPRKFDI